MPWTYYVHIMSKLSVNNVRNMCALFANNLVLDVHIIVRRINVHIIYTYKFVGCHQIITWPMHFVGKIVGKNVHIMHSSANYVLEKLANYVYIIGIKSTLYFW